MFFECKKHEIYKIVFVFMIIVLSFKSIASTDYITVGDAKNYTYSEPIGTVFVSDPDVLDYKVISNNKVVAFSKSIGVSRMNVYAKDGSILSNNKVYVDLDLSQIRRQIANQYPMLNIKLTSIKDRVSVSGEVISEKQRNDIYDMVGIFLDKTLENYHDIAPTTESASGGTAVPGVDFKVAPWVGSDNYYRWHGVIRNLVVKETSQINVKISIAQVTKSFDETIGVDWSSLGNSSGKFTYVKFKPQDLVTVVNALGNNDIAHILAEPNLTVISGESAHFLSGGEFPILTSSVSGATISFKQYGVSLDIGAKVLNDDLIKLQVAPAVSEIEKTIEGNGFSMPQLKTSETNTTIQLHDGDSFVISGLTNSLDIENESKIPLLGDIPMLGGLFSNDKTQEQKTELVIVATVNLVKPKKETDIVLPYIDKTSTLSRLLNIDTDVIYRDVRSDKGINKLISRGGYIK